MPQDDPFAHLDHARVGGGEFFLGVNEGVEIVALPQTRVPDDLALCPNTQDVVVAGGTALAAGMRAVKDDGVAAVPGFQFLAELIEIEGHGNPLAPRIAAPSERRPGLADTAGGRHVFHGERRRVMMHRSVKIRYIDPVGVSDTVERMAAILGAIKRPETDLEVVTLDPGHPIDNLEYRTYEALVTGNIVRVTRDAAENGFDAVVIGCFYDTAVLAAREISGDAVVVGPAQASLDIVRNLAHRFSVVVGERKWIDEMESLIESYGLRRFLTSMRPIGMRVRELQADPERTKALLMEQAQKAIREDAAEAIVLGCTVEYGFFEELQRTLGVPVIDCLIAAFKSAEHLAGLKRDFGWKPSRVWGGEPPPEEELKRWKLFDTPAPIGTRVRVCAAAATAGDVTGRGSPPDQG
ncbi:aspartate/glutamate racemase family protein [Polyangium sp. 15x6]|uniref:aspartate/glutamate racemase family protein n=1 Tax=Polyangium sp. 15x6 TaxID=3042687 RepID=UPI00249AA185|nr:aspartate/glutamate racemase family protein [Polyangium sp. 15x6]MDI3284117.1 aspartate/glutamate racemase family protein [Polyangium sp. 15x6]